MTSEKQMAANQLNARKSTGPSTLTGKQTVSRNALKHGLFSQQTVLHFENHLDFIELRENLLTSLQPQGAFEALFADRIVSYRSFGASRGPAGSKAPYLLYDAYRVMKIFLDPLRILNRLIVILRLWTGTASTNPPAIQSNNLLSRVAWAH